ncbi:MAG: EAL domain-containing protein [Polyangiaceae bacterium]
MNAHVPQQPLAPPRVLLIGGRGTGAPELLSRLADMGAIVTTATDVGDAHAALADPSHDAVVFDAEFADAPSGLAGPIADGASPLGALGKSLRSEGLPLIFFAGTPSLESSLAAIELGVIDYLTLPLDTSRLRTAVRKATKLRRLAALQAGTIAALDADGPNSIERATLSDALDRSLAFAWIAFQPIVAWESRRVLGYEALLRSKDSTLPHPGAIFDVAERLGRLHDVGARVRELAVAAFREANPSTLLFVNLHPRDLTDPRLLDPGSALSGIAERVVLELTERASLHDMMDVERPVAQLRELGFRMAIDDLGAGYAGLSSFAVLEPEFAKLDMSLVRSIHTSPVRQRLVSSMVSLCRDLNTPMIAEGIETVEERDTLSNLGCDLMQGYLFARPSAGFGPIRF